MVERFAALLDPLRDDVDLLVVVRDPDERVVAADAVEATADARRSRSFIMLELALRASRRSTVSAFDRSR